MSAEEEQGKGKLQKDAGKGPWADRNKGILPDGRYQVAGAEEELERPEKYYNGEEDPGKRGEGEGGKPVFHKQYEGRD